MSQEITEFEFHISPAPSSSRPQVARGTDGAGAIIRRARAASSPRGAGLSTASSASGITPPLQQRTS